jgi:hypothetical protein
MSASRTIRNRASIFGFLIVLSFCAITSAAQSGKKQAHKGPGWGDTIIPGSPVTVQDLAEKVIPDIKIDENKSYKVVGKDLSRIRLLDGVEETGMELDLESDDEREFTGADYLWMIERGEKLLVLILSVDIDRPVIALLKITPQITLLDAVTVAQDAHVSVDAEQVWTIHPQHQAFVVECWHDNSSESYDNYTFISIVNRKLRAVAGPIVSSGFATYSSARERICKTSMTPKFRFVRSPGGGYSGYFDLIDSETTLKVCHRNSEEWSWKTGVVYQKTVRRVLRWGATKKEYRKVSTRAQASR